MPNEDTNIEYVFRATDLASPVVTKTDKQVAAAGASIENTMATFMDSADEAVQAVTAGTTTAGDKIDQFATDVAASLARAGDGFVPLDQAFKTGTKEMQALLKDGLQGARFAFGAFDDQLSASEKQLDIYRVNVENALKFVGNSFKNVFGDAIKAPLEIGGRYFERFALKVGEKAQGAYDAITAFQKGASDKFAALKKTLFENEHSFVAFYDAAIAGAPKLAGALKDRLGAAFTKISTNVKGFFAGLGGGTGGGPFKKALDNVQALGKSLGALTFDRIGRAWQAVGGIASVFFGPLAPILKLLEPIISLISEALEPAFETITAAVKSVFGPFEEIIEVIGQQLAPLVAKFFKPFASLLEIVAVQIGGILGDLLDTGKATGPLAGIFNKLAPVVTKVFEAIGKIAMDLLPTLLDAAGEIGFALANAFADVLKAVLPLLPPVLKLVANLIKYVFAPGLVKIVEGLSAGVTYLAEAATPFFEWLAEQIDYLATSVGDFFGNIGKYAKDFKILFIDPITDGITAVVDAFSFEGVGEAVEAAFTLVTDFFSEWITSLVAMFTGLVDKVVGLFSFSGAAEKAKEAVGGIVSSIADKVPGLGAVAGFFGLGGKKEGGEIPKAAEGAVLTRATPIIAGEAGAEAIIPLERDVPVFREMVDLLGAISQRLNGTLQVEMDDSGGGGSSGGGRGGGAEADLDAGVGLLGLAGGF